MAYAIKSNSNSPKKHLPGLLRQMIIWAFDEPLLPKGGFILESILCIDIPVQMISCTDTDGKITPMRFRFRDKTGELISVSIDKVLSEDQDRNRVGVNFSCAASICGTQKIFRLRYSYFSHEWRLSRVHV